MYEKGVLDTTTAQRKLAALARFGRYKDSIIAEARSRLGSP
jgi:hypothetical protein